MSNVRPHVKPTESVAQFEGVVESAGYFVPDLVPRIALGQMLSFYSSAHAQGCAGASGDMLLFEWGTYNWGEGESFELCLSRQFLEAGGEGDDGISQLRLVFKYPPDTQLSALGEGNRWCASRGEAGEFERFVQASQPFQVVADLEAPSVSLSHHYV